MTRIFSKKNEFCGGAFTLKICRGVQGGRGGDEPRSPRKPRTQYDFHTFFFYHSPVRFSKIQIPFSRNEWPFLRSWNIFFIISSWRKNYIFRMYSPIKKIPIIKKYYDNSRLYFIILRLYHCWSDDSKTGSLFTSPILLRCFESKPFWHWPSRSQGCDLQLAKEELQRNHLWIFILQKQLMLQFYSLY